MRMYMIKKHYHHNPKIYEVEVERTTKHSVWIDGNRRARLSEYECHYDTFEEAKNKLIERYTSKVDYLYRELNSNTVILEYVRGLSKSDTDNQ